ncbi:MAG: hypothetical protein ACLTDI_13695 [Acutalibacteraceae bacterium]
MGRRLSLGLHRTQAARFTLRAGISWAITEAAQGFEEGYADYIPGPLCLLNPRMTVKQTIIEPLLVQGIYEPNEKAATHPAGGRSMNLVGLAKSGKHISP